MTNRRLIGSVTLLALLTRATAGARAEGEGKYPDWGGQWVRTSGIQFDPTKPVGRAQQAPLTFEYAARGFFKLGRWARMIRFSKLKRWGMDVAKRRDSKRAKVALARKIAVILHRMWVDGTTYRWTDAQPTAVQV
jgi:hypothetical protein